MTPSAHRRALFAALACVTALGCALEGDTDDLRGGDRAGDAGTMNPDGPGFDLGLGLADALLPPTASYRGIRATDDDVLAGGESGVSDFVDGARSCFDGEDNDGDEVLDCADEACFSVASCCVGSGRADCCTGPETLATATFDDCASPTACLPASVTFGAPAPFVTAEGLAMGGDALYDSGLLLDAPIDLRGERVTLVATFHDTTTCTGCLDGASFGITAQRSLDDQDHVEPLVALQRNGGGEVRLRLGPRTIERFTVTEGSPFTLVLRPDGVGEVRHAGSIFPFRHTVSREVRAVAWGHSSNPSASVTEGVFLRDLALSRARCGAADGWLDRGPVTGASEGVLGVGGATDTAGTHWVVVETLDGPVFGTLDAGAFEGQALEVAPVAWAEETFGWGLTHDGSDLWVTFLADGGAAFGRARLEGATFVPEAEAFFLPEQAIEHARWVSERANELIVAKLDEAVTLFGRGPDVPGGDWARLPSDLPALTAGAGQPHLLRSREGLWLMHVSRPVGTRRVIELFASDELVAWRPLGVVLAGSGDLDDFDALGTSAPTALVEGDALRLLHVGHDGVRPRLGSARRWLGAER